MRFRIISGNAFYFRPKENPGNAFPQKKTITTKTIVLIFICIGESFAFSFVAYLKRKMQLPNRILAVLCTLVPAAALFAGTPGENRESEERRVYTPAREQVRAREHLITPFYAYYAQGLPAGLSSGGKMAYSTYGTGCAWRYVHPEKTRIALTSLDYRRTDFRFSGGAATPFRHTDSVRASTYQEFINPDNGLALAAIVSGSMAAEDSVALSDGASGLFGLACKQYFSETTSVALGLSALYRTDRERWFCAPFVSVDWRIAPNWNLRTLNGLALTWDVHGSNAFLIDFSVNYEDSAFAVDTADDAAASRGAYRRRSVPVSISGTWNFSENLFFNLGITLNTWSEFRFYRNGNRTDEKFTTDPTLEFSLQAGWRF